MIGENACPVFQQETLLYLPRLKSLICRWILSLLSKVILQASSISPTGCAETWKTMENCPPTVQKYTIH